jgi:hypothetical protein
LVVVVSAEDVGLDGVEVVMFKLEHETGGLKFLFVLHDEVELFHNVVEIVFVQIRFHRH